MGWRHWAPDVNLSEMIGTPCSLRPNLVHRYRVDTSVNRALDDLGAPVLDYAYLDVGFELDHT